MGKDKHGRLYERKDLPTQAEKDAKAAERAAIEIKAKKRETAPKAIKEAKTVAALRQALMDYLGIE